MIQLHYYLDTRAVKEGNSAPLKLVIGKRGQSSQLPTGITLLPKEWNAKGQQVVNHPRKRTLNSDLARIRAEVEDFLRPKIWSGELADLTATEIKYLVDEFINGVKCSVTIRQLFKEYMKGAKKNTAQVYTTALKKMSEWNADAPDTQARSFSVTKANEFAEFMSESLAPNSVSTNIRCFKAVFNSAIDAGKIKSNPFNGIDSSVHDSHSRALSIEQLRTFLFSPTEKDKERISLDFFTLSFLLRAINPVDLRNLRNEDYINGRIYYSRSKTGREFSIKVEPEAEALLARYRGNKYLFRTNIDMYQQLTARASRLGLPKVSMYWARHTLASLLFQQGASVDLVGAILGHSNGRRVTMRYIQVQEHIKDEVIRKLIDWVYKEGSNDAPPEVNHD